MDGRGTNKWRPNTKECQVKSTQHHDSIEY